jgi:hypothetical protein
MHCIPHFDDVVERRAVSLSTFLIQAMGKPVYRGRLGAKTITRAIDDAIVNEACMGRLLERIRLNIFALFDLNWLSIRRA